DMTTQFLIPRLINHAHSAFTELLGDLIMPNGFGLTHCRNRSKPTTLLARLLSFRLDVAQYLRPLSRLWRMSGTFVSVLQEEPLSSRRVRVPPSAYLVFLSSRRIRDAGCTYTRNGSPQILRCSPRSPFAYILREEGSRDDAVKYEFHPFREAALRLRI